MQIDISKDDISVPTDLPKHPKTNSEVLQKNLKWRLKITFQEQQSFNGGPSRKAPGYKLVLWSWLAMTIDALILFSLACVFLILFSFLVHSSLKAVLRLFDGSVVKTFTAVWLCISVPYMVMLRSFLGFSVGEWACGLRLGSIKQRLGRYYIFRVLFRVCLIFVSGIFLLPLISLFLGKDIAGFASGINLVSISESPKT